MECDQSNEIRSDVLMTFSEKVRESSTKQVAEMESMASMKERNNGLPEIVLGPEKESIKDIQNMVVGMQEVCQAETMRMNGSQSLRGSTGTLVVGLFSPIIMVTRNGR